MYHFPESLWISGAQTFDITINFCFRFKLDWTSTHAGGPWGTTFRVRVEHHSLLCVVPVIGQGMLSFKRDVGGSRVREQVPVIIRRYPPAWNAIGLDITH